MKRMSTAATRHRPDRPDRRDLRDEGRVTIDQLVERIRWLDEVLKTLQPTPPEKGVTH
jgi:hypothetical protein